MRSFSQFIQSINIFSVSEESSDSYSQKVQEINEVTNTLKGLDNINTSKLKAQRISVRTYQKLIDERVVENKSLSLIDLERKDKKLEEIEHSSTRKIITTMGVMYGSVWTICNIYTLSNSIENDYIRIPLQAVLALAALECSIHGYNRKRQFYQLRNVAMTGREAIEEIILDRKFEFKIKSDYFAAPSASISSDDAEDKNMRDLIRLR